MLAACCLLLIRCATNPVNKSPQLFVMTEEQEIKKGKELDKQIVDLIGLYEDSSMQRAFREKGNAIAAVSHRNQIPYHFRIIDSDIVNAFAAPGGYVYFTRGMMAYVNDEAQLAGVLGHEIGHVTARHAVTQQRNMTLGSIGLITGAILAPYLMDLLGQSAVNGMEMMLLKFSRENELEADELGVEYASKAGYNANNMAAFFTAFERYENNQQLGNVPEVISTHPNPGNRLKQVRDVANLWQEKLQTASPLVRRNEYLKSIEGMLYGSNPRKGFLENGMFYLPDLNLQFPAPSGWNYKNLPGRVIFSSYNGMSMIVCTVASAKTLQSAADSIIKKLKLKDPETENFNINGLAGLMMTGNYFESSNVRRTKSVNYFFKTDSNTVVHFNGVGVAGDFRTVELRFQRMMEEVKRISSAEKLNRQPERIKLIKVDEDMKLDALFTKLGVPDSRKEEFAILNGMQLTDMLTKDMLIKVAVIKRK